MNAFLSYIVEANLGLIFFMLVYLLFRNENQFGVKRAYLLIALLLSIGLPFLHINAEIIGQVIPSLGEQLSSYLQLPEIVVVGFTTKDSFTAIELVYLAGVIAFGLILVWRLVSLLRLVRASIKYKWHECQVAESIGNTPTFSFFRFIHIGRADLLNEHEKAEVLRHELVHVQQFHSIDLLFVNILAVAFWFNPILLVYRRELTTLHEFEADNAGLEGRNHAAYVELLIKLSLPSSGFVLVNHFNNSMTARRVKMIEAVKRKISAWKIAPVLAAAALFFFVASCQDQVGKNASGESAQIKPKVELRDSVYTVVDQLPEYPGGFEALGAFLMENISYPKDARTEGIQGRVYVSFVVTQTGEVVNVEVTKGVNELLDKEAARVVSKMKSWSPGKHEGKVVNVKYVLPINFKL